MEQIHLAVLRIRLPTATGSGDNAAVDITGADSTSGIASIEYQKVKADESYNANGTWVTWDAANKLSRQKAANT